MLFTQLYFYQESLHNVETVAHVKIVEVLSAFIAEKLSLEHQDIKRLVQMSRLHDIGKIHIPIEIIEKPEKLTSLEYDIIKKHTLYGRDIMREFGFTDEETKIIWQHHERCDGSGYPNGLKCNEIDELAKIVAAIDVFDALLSQRSYKKAWSHKEVYNYFEKASGTEFCKKIVSIILNNFDILIEIRDNIESVNILK